MSQKLVFVVPAPREKREGTSPILRVSRKAIAYVEELAEKTGQPLSVIASELISFGYENASVRYATADERSEFDEHV